MYRLSTFRPVKSAPKIDPRFPRSAALGSDHLSMIMPKCLGLYGTAKSFRREKSHLEKESLDSLGVSSAALRNRCRRHAARTEPPGPTGHYPGSLGTRSIRNPESTPVCGFGPRMS